MSNTRNYFVGISVSVLALMSASEALAADALSPKETYLKYRSALPAANKIEDVSSFMCKKVNDDIAHTPAEMKPMMFGFMKETSPKAVQVVSEEVKGETATVLLEGKSAPEAKDGNAVKEECKGKVTFVREGGIWKIEKESWDIKSKIGGE